MDDASSPSRSSGRPREAVEVAHVGFLQLSPSAERCRDGRPQVLTHRFTGEAVVLDDSVWEKLSRPRMDGGWTLTFIDGYGALWCGQHMVGWASQLLKAGLFTTGKKLYLRRCEQERPKVVDPIDWAKQVLYIALPMRNKNLCLKVLKMPQYARGVHHWFEVQDFFCHVPWGKQHMATTMANYMPVWRRFGESLGLTGRVLFQKGDGALHSYDKVFERHSMSATGMLVFFVHMSCKKRGEGGQAVAAAYCDFMDEVIGALLGGADVEIEVTCSTHWVDATSSVPPVRKSRIDIQGGNIDLGHLADHPALQRKLLKLVVEEASSGSESSLSASRFLRILANGGKSFRHMLGQLVSNLGRVMDIAVAHADKVDNVIDAARSRPQELLDEDVNDALAMGECKRGDGDCDNAPAHARSAMKLGFVRKFHIGKRWHTILRRYYMAGREHFSSIGKLSLVLDASRFQVNSMCGLLGGRRDEDSMFQVQWCPPQAPGLCCAPSCIGGGRGKSEVLVRIVDSVFCRGIRARPECA